MVPVLPRTKKSVISWRGRTSRAHDVPELKGNRVGDELVFVDQRVGTADDRARPSERKIGTSGRSATRMIACAPVIIAVRHRELRMMVEPLGIVASGPREAAGRGRNAAP